MAGTLYLVATPIGNLGDLSLWAAETLEQVDFIAAEDTRVTVKPQPSGAEKPMVSYYRHNTGTRGEELIARLLGGESCALVTDAGTPPSVTREELVAQCAAQEIPWFPSPAPVPLSTRWRCPVCPRDGLPLGLLAMNKKNRRAHLESPGRRAPCSSMRPPISGHLEGPGPSGRTGGLHCAGSSPSSMREVRRTTLGQAVSYYEAHPQRRICPGGGGRPLWPSRRPPWRMGWRWWISSNWRAGPPGHGQRGSSSLPALPESAL